MLFRSQPFLGVMTSTFWTCAAGRGPGTIAFRPRSETRTRVLFSPARPGSITRPLAAQGSSQLAQANLLITRCACPKRAGRDAQEQTRCACPKLAGHDAQNALVILPAAPKVSTVQVGPAVSVVPTAPKTCWSCFPKRAGHAMVPSVSMLRTEIGRAHV